MRLFRNRNSSDRLNKGYYIIPVVIIQAKKFLKGDWLKRMVFQPTCRYFISMATV